MYNLFTIDMESEEEAQEKVHQMTDAGYLGPISMSADGKTVSVDINNPLVLGISKVIEVVSKTLSLCIKERLCYQKVFRHASS